MSGLRSADPAFRLDEDGILAKGEELLAELDVSGPDDELFAAEIDELRELAGQDSAAGAAVAARLELVTAILAVIPPRPGPVNMRLLVHVRVRESI